MKVQGLEIRKVKDFKCWSRVHSRGGCGNKDEKCVEAGWNSWRTVLDVLCSTKVSARSKGKVRWWLDQRCHLG